MRGRGRGRGGGGTEWAPGGEHALAALWLSLGIRALDVRLSPLGATPDSLLCLAPFCDSAGREDSHFGVFYCMSVWPQTFRQTPRRVANLDVPKQVDSFLSCRCLARPSSSSSSILIVSLRRSLRSLCSPLVLSLNSLNSITITVYTLPNLSFHFYGLSLFPFCWRSSLLLALSPFPSGVPPCLMLVSAPLPFFIVLPMRQQANRQIYSVDIENRKRERGFHKALLPQSTVPWLAAVGKSAWRLGASLAFGSQLCRAGNG